MADIRRDELEIAQQEQGYWVSANPDNLAALVQCNGEFFGTLRR